jgi:hypothetical protein
MTDFVKLWVYLSGSPLLWLTATLVAYAIADAIAVACKRHPLANPVLMRPVPNTRPISPEHNLCISCSGPPPWR